MFWLDAPIGYFASLKNYCEAQGIDFDAFVKPGGAQRDDPLHRQDIIYFHTRSGRPCSSTPGYKTPDSGSTRLHHRLG